jgi:hypothetical protein
MTIKTVGNIKPISVEQYLKLTKTDITTDILIKETIFSIEHLFKVDLRKVIFNHSLESTFIVYCFVRYLIYEKDVIAGDILHLFEGKYKTSVELTKLTSANKSTHIKIKYSNVKEQLDKILHELTL